MGDTTAARHHHTADRSRTARYLALPGAVALHVLGTLATGLVLGALVPSAPGSSLVTVTTVVSVGISLAVLALCAAAVLAHVPAERSGASRNRARTVAWSALAASLVLDALYALLWYTGIAVDLVMSLGTAVSVAAMLLAALALVCGLVATADAGPARPGRSAVTVAAIATPAALLTPLIGMVARTPGAYTVATYAGAALALAGLAAAVVARRRAPNDGAVAREAASTVPVAGAGGRGRRFLRYLATPLALLALVLALPAPSVGDDGGLAVTALVAAFALAAAAIAGAVLDVRAERRSGRVRVASRLAVFTLALAVALVPAAVAIAALSGDEEGWAMLGALFISVPLAALVALVGLIAAIVAAAVRQYPGRAAAASVLCTGLIPLALLLFVPLQAAGLALVSAVLAGLLLLAALVTGVVAVARGETAPTTAPDAPADAVAQNPYR